MKKIPNVLNLFKSGDNGNPKKTTRVKKEKEKGVVFVQNYINDISPDVLHVSMLVHGLNKKSLDGETIKKNDGYHRNKYQDHVGGLKQGYSNEANHAKNQLKNLYPQGEKLEKDIEKTERYETVPDDSGKKPWTLTGKRLFRLYIAGAVLCVLGAASAIQAIVVNGYPAMSSFPLRSWCYGVLGGVAGGGTFFGIGYGIGIASKKAEWAYFLALEIFGAIAALVLVTAIARIGMGTGSQELILDFTTATATVNSYDDMTDFLLTWSEIAAEWIFAAILIKKAVDKFQEFRERTKSVENPDYKPMVAELATLNSQISHWEEKVADNNALLEIIRIGEDRYAQKADALLRSRYQQNRLSFGILD